MKSSLLICGVALALGWTAGTAAAKGPNGKGQSLDPQRRQKLIAEFDTDGDGELNEVERQKARQSMRERRQDHPEGRGGPSEGQRGRKSGDRGPGGPEGRSRGDRGPGGPEGRSRGDRRPGGPEGRSRGDRGPGGPEGRSRGDRRPGGPEGRPRGDRRPGGPEGRPRGNRGPHGQSPVDLGSMFNQFDKNSDGSLSREEFELLTREVRQMRQNMKRQHGEQHRRSEDSFGNQELGPGGPPPLGQQFGPPPSGGRFRRPDGGRVRGFGNPPRPARRASGNQEG
jgi:hypothetical protein